MLLLTCMAFIKIVAVHSPKLNFMTTCLLQTLHSGYHVDQQHKKLDKYIQCIRFDLYTGKSISVMQNVWHQLSI